MHIAFDARAYGWTGVGRYIRNLITEYGRLDHPHTFTFAAARRDSAPLQQQLRRWPARNWSIAVVDGSYYSWREQAVLPWQLAGIKADMWHFTHFNVPRLFNRPYLVTIHDVTRFLFPGQQRQGLVKQLAYEYLFKTSVERADGIICVSNSTRRELQQLPFTLQAAPHVVYEGVEPQFFATASHQDRRAVRQLVGPQPYLLSVGVWMSHKNLRRLLVAFKMLRVELPSLQLVITGTARPGYIDVPGLVKTLGLSAAVRTIGFVDDPLLPALYQEASCFVFPSLYEGFGLPPLEAAAGGTPVVASHVSSIPEIMGDGALYVNPEDPRDIARGMARLLQDESQRNAFINRGRQRARQFKWQQCAEQTLLAYQAARDFRRHEQTQ